MGFVLDSSVTLAWLLPDEESQGIDALADRLEREDAEVPAIWALEVGNALVSACRRARIDDAGIQTCLGALAALPINPDRPPRASELSGIIAIATRFGLTTYDASYFELAHRTKLPLATLDRRLRDACGELGLAVLPGTGSSLELTGGRSPRFSPVETSIDDPRRRISWRLVFQDLTPFSPFSLEATR